MPVPPEGPATIKGGKMLDLKATSGASKIVIVICIVVLALGGFTAWKFIDASIKTQAMEDDIQGIARFGSDKTDKDLMYSVMKASRTRDIPLKEEQVTIARQGGRIHISVAFVLEVKTPLFTYQWNQEYTKSSSEY